MAKVIKNIDVVEHTYAGQTIAAGASYTIQIGEHFKWASSDTLLADISDGKAQVNNGIADIVGISAQINYLLDQDTSPRDADNALITRFKAAKAGWTYHMSGVEFETSVLSSLNHKDVSGNNLNEATIKYYDINNNELTTQGSCDTDCVKTVMSFEPTWDYEIIGGTLKTISSVSDDIRVWIIGVPDIPANQGGSKVMVQNINLRFIDPNNGIVTDGRASKYMTYNATYHTNKLQFTLKHTAGFKEKIMVAFELFRN